MDEPGKLYWVKDFAVNTNLTGFLVSTEDIPDELWNAFEPDHGFWSTGLTKYQLDTVLHNIGRLENYLPNKETVEGGARKPTGRREPRFAYLPKAYEHYFLQKNKWGDIFP